MPSTINDDENIIGAPYAFLAPISGAPIQAATFPSSAVPPLVNSTQPFPDACHTGSSVLTAACADTTFVFTAAWYASSGAGVVMDPQAVSHKMHCEVHDDGERGVRTSIVDEDVDGPQRVSNGGKDTRNSVGFR